MQSMLLTFLSIYLMVTRLLIKVWNVFNIFAIWIKFNKLKLRTCLYQSNMSTFIKSFLVMFNMYFSFSIHTYFSINKCSNLHFLIRNHFTLICCILKKHILQLNLKRYVPLYSNKTFTWSLNSCKLEHLKIF